MLFFQAEKKKNILDGCQGYCQDARRGQQVQLETGKISI